MTKTTKEKTDWKNLQRSAVEAEHAERVRELNAQIERHEHAIKSLADQLDVALAVNKTKLRRVEPVRSAGVETEAAAVAVASDWHVEEVVQPASVNGLNDFNLGVAEQRVGKFFDGILRLTEIQRQGVKIDTLVLVLGGDFMSGHIHEELAETNELTPVQTVVWLRDQLVAGIERLKRDGAFKRIIVPCCYGNHGRTTKKMRFGTGAANSYEWLLYQILAKQVAGVEWQIAESYHNYLNVYGTTLRIHHGDAIRYQGGIGGLTVPVEKAIASWDKALKADLDLFGHWHQYQQNPKWCSNGSLIGYNAFALQIKAPFEPPQQTFFLLDSKRGRTITAPISLT